MEFWEGFLVEFFVQDMVEVHQEPLQRIVSKKCSVWSAEEYSDSEFGQALCGFCQDMPPIQVMIVNRIEDFSHTSHFQKEMTCELFNTKATK